MAPKIARADRVDREEVLSFVRQRHAAVLITTRADGRPQASPVTCGLTADGHVAVATYPERAKTRNARRHPAVSLVILSDDFNGPWVQLDGTAEVVDATESVEPFVEYFRSISGEHPDWDEYREAMARQGKSLLRIRIDDWGPIATGGFPPRLWLSAPPRLTSRDLNQRDLDQPGREVLLSRAVGPRAGSGAARGAPRCPCAGGRTPST